MIDLGYLIKNGSTFIYTEKDKVFGITILNECGITVPIELSSCDISSIYKCENIMKKLQEGNTLYIKNGSAYIGKKGMESPYCEKEVLDVLYETNGCNLGNMIYSLDDNIKNNKVTEKKLVKIGERYEQ